MMRWAVFLEGCALRVRMPRPYARRGMSWGTPGSGSLRGVGCRARWLNGHDESEKGGYLGGRAEPAP